MAIFPLSFLALAVIQTAQATSDLPTADSLSFVTSLEQFERDIVRDLRAADAALEPAVLRGSAQYTSAFIALDKLDLAVNRWYAAEVSGTDHGLTIRSQLLQLLPAILPNCSLLSLKTS
jgi:hypothetical protein